MNGLKKIITVSLIATSLAGTAFYVQAKDNEQNDATAIMTAKVTVINAIDIALQQMPGKVTRAEFEHENAGSVWEVEVLADSGKTYDIVIDANTSKISKQSLDNNDDERED